jgi:hypothetical protein
MYVIEPASKLIAATRQPWPGNGNLKLNIIKTDDGEYDLANKLMLLNGFTELT